jgi:hypothetical protein
MALRWASVGACENAGVATANMIVVIHAHRVAARPDVLIISINPYRCCRRRGLDRCELLKRNDGKIFARGIIFPFGFHRKWIVAIFMG